MASRLNRALGIITTLRRAGMIAPMRPDSYLKMAEVPRELSVLDELPRRSTGKVLRNEPKSRVSG